ncbi:hypothetical protein cyc_03394 [Cyclospora cayetanensis]|uniref:tRNA-uridine aminocarboxypropyltransferase n=1 Tax=Cyclospora cayetanensis TaxID=88456 RepID=A0A1D3CZK9_9EIME|nr:hypothetical protein cyc_03394 [Cyclospora cayetanensis]
MALKKDHTTLTPLDAAESGTPHLLLDTLSQQNQQAPLWHPHSHHRDRDVQQEIQQEREKHNSHGEHVQQEQNKRVKRRHVCEGCGRPSSVCYCSTVSGRELNLSDPSVSAIVDRVLVFLHPLERKRKNGSLQAEGCQSSAEAERVESSLPLGTGSLPLRLPITLLAIDGTWKEANEMLRAAPWLQQLPAVHLPHSQVLPVEQGDPLEGVSSFATASGRSTCSTTRSESCEEALRVSGAYGLIRTPPARVAAKGGVCTAEAIAEALAILGRWGRTTAPSLLQIADTTRQTLQRIVALQQQMRKQTKNSENTLDSAIGAKGAATPRRPSS